MENAKLNNEKYTSKILFDFYPDIKHAYDLTHRLRMIYSHTKDKGIAYTKLAKWFNDITDS